MIDNIRVPLSRTHRSAIGATRLSITLTEYEARIAAGERWCYACSDWHPIEQMRLRSSKREGVDNICKQQSARRARIAIARRRARLAS